MKKLVWVAGAVLLLALFFPNGVSVPWPQPEPEPAPVVPVVQPDATIVQLLAPASREERNRIVGVYEGLRAVLSRDAGNRVNNTEKWAELQANTLQLAIETPGKYPGLDVAIETVFSNAVQSETTDPAVVNPVKGDVLAALLNACEIVVASARIQ